MWLKVSVCLFSVLFLFFLVVLPEETFGFDILELPWFMALLDQYGVVVMSGDQVQVRVLFIDGQQLARIKALLQYTFDEPLFAQLLLLVMLAIVPHGS